MSILKSTNSGFRVYIYKILKQRNYLTFISVDGRWYYPKRDSQGCALFWIEKQGDDLVTNLEAWLGNFYTLRIESVTMLDEIEKCWDIRLREGATDRNKPNFWNECIRLCEKYNHCKLNEQPKHSI